MEVQFKIKPKGGATEMVTAELVDVIAWEEKFQRPSTELGGDTIFARDFVWLGFVWLGIRPRYAVPRFDRIDPFQDTFGEICIPLPLAHRSSALSHRGVRGEGVIGFGHRQHCPRIGMASVDDRSDPFMVIVRCNPIVLAPNA